MLQKLIASSLFLASLLFGQEPSAFNAGGSTSPKSESQIINEKQQEEKKKRKKKKIKK